METLTLPGNKQKPCTKCGVVQPLDCYALVKNRHGNRHPIAQCRTCRTEIVKEYHKNNAEKQRENVRRWKAQNPEAVQRYCEEWNEVRRRVSREQSRRRYCSKQSCSKQAEKLRRQRNYENLTGAIQEGKSCPIRHHFGFSIAINREGVYRAARLDKPLLPGERALTCYEFHNAEWGVYPPLILVAGSREMTDWCERYEMRQKQKAQVV